jgi:TRAP-type transport system periplasmic protein
MPQRGGALLGLVLISAVAAGCTGASPGANKAGGQTVRQAVVLRLASTPQDLSFVPPVAEFVHRVASLSGGAIEVKVINQWGNYAPDAEAQVVRAVASGSADLGWAGSRVFDSMGVSNFEALSAPMLIDNYRLEHAALQTALPGQMLAGLKSLGATGLGLFGDGLRLPISVGRPLLAPTDWRGISFGTYRSDVQAQAIRALGATPVVAFGPFRSHDLDTREIQGFELDVRPYAKLGLEGQAPYVAANVVLWPEFDVLFANPGRLSSLTDQQRGWLEQAAQEVATDSAGLGSTDATYISEACAAGSHFVNATSADLAALRRSLSVVYQQLERDPTTKPFIQQILGLKTSTPSVAAIQVPAGCAARP